MPGAGTKAISTGSRPALRLLDLTRLVSRVGRGAWTGVDRVERAYLSAVIAAPEPGFGLVRTALGYCLLDQAGLVALAARLDGHTPWGPADLVGRLSRKLSPVRQRAEGDLRRLAIATGPLGRVLRALPAGGAYLNVGHSHLDAAVLQRLGRAGLQRTVLIHDTIPLDYPEYQRPGTPARFREKLEAAVAGADVILTNSHVTAEDLRRHLAGRTLPPITVAPLGVEVPEPDPQTVLPAAPYFVTLSTIEPRKNHGFLLGIWDSFAADPPDGPVPQLHIIGARGWENAEVFARLDALAGSGGPVTEHGSLPDGAAAALIAGSAGVLFPSHAEGYGLPPLEAVALGKTPICAPLSIYKETLGNIGIYASTHDVYLWRKEILNLVQAEQTGDDRRRGERISFHIPTWTDHFSLVLKVT